MYPNAPYIPDNILLYILNTFKKFINMFISLKQAQTPILH